MISRSFLGSRFAAFHLLLICTYLPGMLAAATRPETVAVPGGKVRKAEGGCYVHTTDIAYDIKVERLAERALRRADEEVGCLTYPYRGDQYGDAGTNSDFHAGLDLRAPVGQPVYAIEAGEVRWAELDKKGTPEHSTLIIENWARDRKWFYLHLDSHYVKQGDKIEQGQKIGRSGEVGTRGSPHLHIEVWPSTSKHYEPRNGAIRNKAITGTACAGICTDLEIASYTMDPADTGLSTMVEPKIGVWQREDVGGSPVAVTRVHPSANANPGTVDVRIWEIAGRWKVGLTYLLPRNRFGHNKLKQMLNESGYGIGVNNAIPDSLEILNRWDSLDGRIWVSKARVSTDLLDKMASADLLWLATDFPSAERDIDPSGIFSTEGLGLTYEAMKQASLSNCQISPKGCATVPPFPYIQRNPYYTSVQLGSWQLTTPAILLTSADAGAAQIAKLPATSLVSALQVEVHTVRPAVCEAVRDAELMVTQQGMLGGSFQTREKKVPVVKGDRIYELAYYEEGECTVWANGVVGLSECGGNSLAGGPELCRYLGSQKPVAEIWAYVATPDGKRGWIREPQAKGMSRHD